MYKGIQAAPYVVIHIATWYILLWWSYNLDDVGAESILAAFDFVLLNYHLVYMCTWKWMYYGLQYS